MDADTLAKQQQEQDAMVEEQKQARPLLQKQNEMSLLQDQPVLVDNDEELDKILEVWAYAAMKNAMSLHLLITILVHVAAHLDSPRGA